MASELVSVTVADGKYTIREKAPYKWECLRYGEHWPAFDNNGPDNLHIALAHEVDRLRKEAATRPAPAATDTGLVRYDLSIFGNGIVEMGGGAYVRADQAEELLAAERAEKDIAERNRDAARENFLTIQKSAAKLLERAEKAEADLAAERDKVLFLKTAMEIAQTHCGLKDKTIDKLEADNAAKAARIKELDRCHEGTIDLCNQKTAQIETLEAKLAAAEMFIQFCADGFFVTDDELRDAARAALGGKPSC